MARGGYPFGPHPPPHPDAAAAAYYAQQYGAAHGYPPNFHVPSDPRQMEAAHHQQQYWMEMEARRRHFAMMKQAQEAQHRRQHR